jgi:hypothetical protein
MRVPLSLAVFGIAFASLATLVHAAGPLIVNGAGTPLAWRSIPIPFNPDRGGLGTRTNAQAVSDIMADFAKWAGVSTANVSFTNAGAMPVDVTAANYTSYLGVCNDGLDPIVFDTDGSIIDDLFGVGASNEVVASGSPDCQDYTSATITEGSVVINGKWIDGINTNANPELLLTDLSAVVIHEFGHYIGLDNSQINLKEANTRTTSDDNAVATMYPFLINGTQQIILNLDDQVSVSTLYPAPSFSSSFGRITGNILLPNREGAFQGAYVIARNVNDPRMTAVGVASGARFFPGTPGGFPSPALRAFYEIPGLPAGSYTVEIEEIDQSFTDDQSVGPLDPPAQLPGPAEFWNGTNESNTSPPDSPTSSVPINISAGQTVSGIDIVINGSANGLSNDVCTAPTVISAVPFSTSIKTTTATTGIYDPFQTCSAGEPSQNSNSVWYVFTPSSNGTVTASTAGSSYDTVLTAYTGSCSVFTQIACNDDSAGTVQSQISFAVIAGTPYTFEATDFDGVGGTLHFALTMQTTSTTSTTSTTRAVTSTTSSTTIVQTTTTATTSTSTTTTTITATTTTRTTTSTVVSTSTTTSTTARPSTTTAAPSTTTSTTAAPPTTTSAVGPTSTTTSSSQPTSTSTTESTTSTTTSSSTTTTSPLPPSLSATKCYRTHAHAAFATQTMTLADDFGAGPLIVTRPEAFCAPAGLNGQAAASSETYQTCYGARDGLGQEPFTRPEVTVDSPFGRISMLLGSTRALCLPAELNGLQPTGDVKPLKCYATSAERPKRAIIQLQDDFETTEMLVGQPVSLCSAATMQGDTAVGSGDLVVCYRLRRIRGEPQFSAHQVDMQTTLGESVLRLTRSRTLCVPVTPVE